MKQLFISLIIVSLLFTTGIASQSIANYGFSTSTAAVLENMSTGTTSLIGPSAQDVASAVTNIGFSFSFMGNTFTQFSVNSNGQLRLGATVISGAGITNAALNTPLLVAMSGGNAILSTGKVHYKVKGTAPDRILIVEWKDLNVPDPILDNNPPIAEYNPTLLQVYMYETTGIIKFKYGTVNNNSVSSVTRSTFIASSNTVNTVKYIAPNMISAANGSSAGTYPLTLSNTDLLTLRQYVFTPSIPDAPTVNVVNNCDGTSTLTASNYTGTLLWSTMETTSTITVTVPGVYTVTQTVGGFTSEPGSGTAAPKTAPPAPTVTLVNNCNGTSTLTASNYSGTLLWCTNETTASITVTEAGPHWVYQTVNGCTSLPGTVIADPHMPLQASVNVVADNNTVCSGTTVKFTATPVNGGNFPVYNWYVNSSPVGSNLPTFTYTPSNGDQVYVIMTSDATPCLTGSPATSNIITLNVNPGLIASVTLVVNYNPVNLGRTVTFTAIPQGGGTSPEFSWYRNNLLIPNTGPEYTYTPLDKDEVYVEMTTNAASCQAGNIVRSNTIRMSVSLGTFLDQNGTDQISIYSTDKAIFVNSREVAKQILLYNSMGSLISADQHVVGIKKFELNAGASQYYFVKIITQNSVYTQRVLLK